MKAPCNPCHVDAMNDLPPDGSVRAGIQQLRCEIDGGMEDVAASAGGMLDWKHHVKTYPCVCLAAAVALGFLVVPKRSKTKRPDVVTVAELAKTGHSAIAPSFARGVIEAMLIAAANVALRKVVAYLAERFNRVSVHGVHTGSAERPERDE